MAYIEEQKGWYRLVVKYGGKKFQKALQTESKKHAEQLCARADENLQLLRRGRLPYNAGVDDLITILLSDGKLTQEPLAEKQITLGAFLKDYEAAAVPGKEENTSYTEKIHIAHLLRLLGSKTPIHEIPARLQEYVTKRAQEKRNGPSVSHVTIRKELGTLSSIWNKWGVNEKKVVGPLSLKNLGYPKRKEKPPFQTWEQITRRIAKGKLTAAQEEELWDSLYLTLTEISELLDHVKTAKMPWTGSSFPWLWPMFVFAAHTGCRRSEMMRARVEDVDFEHHEVTIREKKKDRTAEFTFRKVPMSKLLKSALESWVKVHPGGPVLFCKAPEEPISPQMADHYFRYAVGESKWKVLKGWHTLRHSFVSNLASQVDQRVLMDLVGHLNVQTHRRYQHLLPSIKQAAVRSIFG